MEVFTVRDALKQCVLVMEKMEGGKDWLFFLFCFFVFQHQVSLCHSYPGAPFVNQASLELSDPPAFAPATPPVLGLKV